MSPRADQAAIDTPLVRELVDSQFPQWAALPLEPFKSGGRCNAIYRLGPALSVRLSLWSAGADVVHREQEKLAALAPFLPVAIPAVEAIGSPTDAFPGEWSVHRWLTGTHPAADALVDPHGLAMDLATFVHARSAGSTCRTGRPPIRASDGHAPRWIRWTLRHAKRSAAWTD